MSAWALWPLCEEGALFLITTSKVLRHTRSEQVMNSSLVGGSVVLLIGRPVALPLVYVKGGRREAKESS